MARRYNFKAIDDRTGRLERACTLLEDGEKAKIRTKEPDPLHPQTRARAIGMDRAQVVAGMKSAEKKEDGATIFRVGSTSGQDFGNQSRTSQSLVPSSGGATVSATPVLSLSNNQVLDSAANGTVVGVVSLQGSLPIISLSSSNALFGFSGTSLVTAGDLSSYYGQTISFDITARSSDSIFSLPVTTTVTVTVTQTWVLTSPSNSTVVADLDFNFSTGKAWYNGARSAFADVLSTARSSSGTYTPASGTLTSFGSTTLRIGDNGLLTEDSRTNVVLWNRDLTNAAWAKTNATAAKDQVGIDGTSNVASSLTATANNATCLQSITLASSARAQTAYVKRITGSGDVSMTMDGGSTWTVITLTSAFQRLTIPTQTLANPSVGFKLATSGDKIAVDYVQNENGAIETSPIATTTVSVSRAADAVFADIAADLFVNSAITIYAEYFNPQTGSNLGSICVLRKTATTFADRIELAGGNTSTSRPRFQVVVGAVASVDMTANPAPSIAPNVIEHAVVTVDASSAAAAISYIPNASGDDISVTLPSGLDRIDIGHRNGTNSFNGYLRRIAVFKSRQSDANILALSAHADTPLVSLHFLGDSFLNNYVLSRFVSAQLTSVVRSTTQDGVGGSTLVDQRGRFDLTPLFYDRILIIMDGGETDTLANAQASILAEVAHLTNGRWLYVQSGLDTGRSAGTSARAIIDSVNNWMVSTYPGNYVETKTTMQSYAIPADPNDATDIANDIWPRSQTVDGLHPTTTPVTGGYAHLSTLIANAIIAKGW
jgi:hypothetical protein